MWDTRFAGDEYLFGTAPAAFLPRQAKWLTPGSSVLAVADGEGRNSVWMAQQGLRVTAMDSSKTGLAKARALAQAKGVSVDFQHGDATDWDWTAHSYDVVAAIFIQFAGPSLRAQILAGLDAALAPGGLLLLHGFAPRQIEYATGGPPHRENMYTLPMLKAAFPGYEILHSADYDELNDTGAAHDGLAALIDFTARKPREA